MNKCVLANPVFSCILVFQWAYSFYRCQSRRIFRLLTIIFETFAHGLIMTTSIFNFLK